MKKIIHDVQTQEIYEVEMTSEEISEIEKNRAKLLLELEEQRKIEIESLAKRQALLAKLGITEEEAKLLLGGN